MTRPLRDGPILAPLLALHPPGDPDHWVAFTRRDWMPFGYPIDGAGRPVRGSVSKAVDDAGPGFIFEPLWSIRARDLREVFPQIKDPLVKESFFTINGMFLARRVVRPADPVAGTPMELGASWSSGTKVVIDGRPQFLPRASWGKRRLRRLTAVWADLDYYKLGLTEEGVLGSLRRMEAAGVLPAISMILYSGRGLWAFWLLRDHEDAAQSVRAWAENLERWRRIQRSVNHRVAHLGADPAAVDAARITRVPGSCRHAEEGVVPARVRYWLRHPPEASREHAYTLGDLERFLRLEPLRRDRRRPGTAASPAERERKRKGSRGRIFVLLRQLEALEAMRKGWKIGTRGRALWLWIACVVSVRRLTQNIDDIHTLAPEMQRIARLTDDDLFQDAMEIARRVEPGAGFSAKVEVRAGLELARKDGGIGSKETKGKPPSNRTIAGWLSVTPHESGQLRDLGFKSPLPPARRFVRGTEPTSAPKGRAVRAVDRRVAVRAIVEDRERAGAPQPTLRAIAAELDRRGIDSSLRTVMIDLAALGIENPRGRERQGQERERVQAAGRLPFEAPTASTGIGTSDERSAG